MEIVRGSAGQLVRLNQKLLLFIFDRRSLGQSNYFASRNGKYHLVCLYIGHLEPYYEFSSQPLRLGTARMKKR